MFNIGELLIKPSILFILNPSFFQVIFKISQNRRFLYRNSNIKVLGAFRHKIAFNSSCLKPPDKNWSFFTSVHCRLSFSLKNNPKIPFLLTPSLSFRRNFAYVWSLRYTDTRSCYQTPEILTSDFINFRENQE